MFIPKGIEWHVDHLRTNLKGEIVSYNKEQPMDTGRKLVELILALKDGVDVEDSDEFISFGTALMGSIDEIKEDTDAAVLHLVSGITDRLGDERLDPPTPTP